MARIREALRRPDPTRGQPLERDLAPRPYQPDEDQLRPEVEEEIPFIEVGGRQTPMEASPSVLAGMPKTVHRSPPLEPVQAPASVARPSRVAFRRFPPEPVPLRSVSERFDSELVVVHQPDHPLSEQYRVLLGNLESQLPAGQSQTLLFTSSTPQTDPSTVLLNLAITRARQNTTRDLVVDADLRRPALAERLGLPPGPGLSDVLAGRVSLPRAIQETGQPNLYALTSGKTAPDRFPLVAGEAMRAIMRQLRGRFDCVFVNLPYWDGRPEALVLGSVCEAVYLVLPEADAETGSVRELSELILQQGGCLQGYILV